MSAKKSKRKGKGKLGRPKKGGKKKVYAINYISGCTDSSDSWRTRQCGVYSTLEKAREALIDLHESEVAGYGYDDEDEDAEETPDYFKPVLDLERNTAYNEEYHVWRYKIVECVLDKTRKR